MLDTMEICAECNRPIEDQYVLRVGDSSLHQDCLRCASCRVPLTDSCFSKFGQFYCRPDFYRMFGPRCAACQLVFTESDRARKIGDALFHTHCFTCRDCSANLTEGDKVGCDHRGNLFCEIDYIKHKNSSPSAFFSSSSLSSHSTTSSSSSSSDLLLPPGGGHGGSLVSDDTSQYLDLDNNSNTTGGRCSSSEELTVKRESTPARSPAMSADNASDDDGDGKGEGEIGKDGKRRGPRTTIKAKQLEVLKTCFDQNPKPTRQVREQLAKETGLPMRVIQVWFQNKRSKQKRIHQLHFMSAHHHRMGLMPPFLPPHHPHHHHRRMLHMGGGFPPPPHMPFPPDFRPPFPGDFPDFHHHQQQHHGGFPMEQMLPPCDFNTGGSNSDVSNDSAGLPYPSPPVPGSGEFASSSPNASSASSSLPAEFAGSADHCFPSPPLSDCSLPDYHVPPPSEPILC